MSDRCSPVHCAVLAGAWIVRIVAASVVGGRLAVAIPGAAVSIVTVRTDASRQARHQSKGYRIARFFNISASVAFE